MVVVNLTFCSPFSFGGSLCCQNFEYQMFLLSRAQFPVPHSHLLRHTDSLALHKQILAYTANSLDQRPGNEATTTLSYL